MSVGLQKLIKMCGEKTAVIIWGGYVYNLHKKHITYMLDRE